MGLDCMNYSTVPMNIIELMLLVYKAKIIYRRDSDG